MWNKWINGLFEALKMGIGNFGTFFHFILFINYYSASTPNKSIKICKSRCTLHRSSDTIQDRKRYILRILLKILISEDCNVKSFYLYETRKIGEKVFSFFSKIKHRKRNSINY